MNSINPSPRDAIEDLVAAAALCGDPTAIASLRVRSFRDLYGCGFASLEQKTHLLELAVEYVTCQCVCAH